jgi:hypothetical protein
MATNMMHTAYLFFTALPIFFKKKTRHLPFMSVELDQKVLQSPSPQQGASFCWSQSRNGSNLHARNTNTKKICMH